MDEVRGTRVRGSPRLGWMDGVKVVLGSIGMTVEVAPQCTKDWKRTEFRAKVHMWMIEFHAAIFAWFLCSFIPPSRVLVGLGRSPGNGRDAVE